MKTSFLTMAALAANLAMAQKRADYFPKCSLDCLSDATTSATDCSVDDAWCWCIQSNYEAIYRAGTLCVVQECGTDVALDQVLPAAVPFCSAATSAHNAASTAAEQPASSSAAAAPTTTSAAAQQAETTSAAAAETTSAVAESSAAPATSSSAPAAAESSSAVVSHTVVPAPSQPVNGTAPSSTPNVPTNGAASAGPAGLVAMLALGALAAGI